MTNEHYEHCAICDCFTGKAGPADDSIYWLDGEIGPLCETCSNRLEAEVLKNLGFDLVEIKEHSAVTALEDLAETAWGIIANVYGGWNSASEASGWKAAAERWRENYKQCGVTERLLQREAAETTQAPKEIASVH